METSRRRLRRVMSVVEYGVCIILKSVDIVLCRVPCIELVCELRTGPSTPAAQGSGRFIEQVRVCRMCMASL